MSKNLLHDLEHHAKDKADLAAILALVFATQLNPKGWQVKHRNTGSNSWSIELERPGTYSLIWYFTGYTRGMIIARNERIWDTARLAGRIVPMRTRVEVLRWARSL